MIRKISEYETTDNFNQVESMLFSENNIPVTSYEDMEKYFPDLVNPVHTFSDFFKIASALENTSEFVSEIINHPKSEPISILTDNDCDGCLGGVIMAYSLIKAGYTVFIDSPNRLTDYFGDQTRFIEKHVNEDKVTLFITVDNGISGIDIETECDKYNVKLIVTDHHLEDGKMPKHSLIVDPNYNSDEYKDSCGAVVALKLMYALYEKLNLQFNYDLCAYAGIATVADMMKLLGENRYLVKLTLDRINEVKFKNQWWSILFKLVRNVGGYKFMVDENQKNRVATEELISINVAPNINAISRVNGDVNEFLQNLLKAMLETKTYLQSYAKVNFERMKLSRILLDDYEDEYPENKSSIYVYNQDDYDFPIKGMLGLVSNRMTKDTGKVTLVGMNRGLGQIEFSGRSSYAYNLHEGIERLASEYPDLKITGGGHSNAMGIKIADEPGNLEIFREALEKDVEEHFEFKEPSIFLFEEELDDLIVSTIRKYFPFGSGFKKPEFIYTGLLKFYDPVLKEATIGDYLFTITLSSEFSNIDPDNLQEVTVKFNIVFYNGKAEFIARIDEDEYGNN